MTAIALTIAGSDSGGGAGVQADLKTFGALGVYGASAITALTAQNTIGVHRVMTVEPAMVTAQIDAVFSDLKVNAVKIGMLATAELIGMVAAGLGRWGAENIVLDPVMVAQSGDALIKDDAVDALTHLLLRRVDLITPNLPEAARLLGVTMARDEAEMLRQGEALLRLGAKAVLMKGGHAEGAEAVDFLLTGQTRQRFAAPRVPTRNTHGTGCTLSSAIAAWLARGMVMEEAIRAAKAYVTAAIIAADALDVGRGAGPLDHFHALKHRAP